MWIFVQKHIRDIRILEINSFPYVITIFIEIQCPVITWSQYQAAKLFELLPSQSKLDILFPTCMFYVFSMALNMNWQTESVPIHTITVALW